MGNTQNKRFLFFLLLIHLIFFIAQLFLQNYEMSDSKDYLWMAQNISKGELYCGDLNSPINPDLYTKRPPGYPIFLFFAQNIINHPFFILFLQNVFSFLSLLWVRNSLLQYGNKEKFDKYFLLFSLFSPAQFIYANMIMSEIFFQFIIVGMFLQLLYFVQKKKHKYLLYYHLLLSIGLLTKPILFPFAFISIFYVLYLVFRNKKYKYLGYSIIPIIIIFLYLNYNESKTGVRHFSSIQKINLIDYNINYYLVSSKGEEYADSVVSKIKAESNKIDEYAKNYTFTMQKGKEIITNNFLSYTLYHIKGSWRLFLDPGRFDLSTFLGLEKEQGKGIFHRLNTSGWLATMRYIFSQNIILLLGLALIFTFNFIKTISLFFFAKNVKIPLEIRIFVILLLLYFAGVTGSIAASRFMVPMLPMLIGISSIELSNLKINILNLRKRN